MLVLYTLFTCVVLDLVCDALCVFVDVRRSCIVVVRVDCFRLGCYLLVVVFASLLLCGCVLSRVLPFMCLVSFEFLFARLCPFSSVLVYARLLSFCHSLILFVCCGCSYVLYLLFVICVVCYCLYVCSFVVARGCYVPFVVLDCMLNGLVCFRVVFVTLFAFVWFDVCVCCFVFVCVRYCLYCSLWWVVVLVCYTWFVMICLSFFCLVVCLFLCLIVCCWRSACLLVLACCCSCLILCVL